MAGLESKIRIQHDPKGIQTDASAGHASAGRARDLAAWGVGMGVVRWSDERHMRLGRSSC